jgi:glycine/D-amino acid oxidase-like deaminating enzyme
VTVLEARRVGRQVTGRSTAKVTSQHTLIYKYLIENFGFEAAQSYAEANQTAVRNICEWVKTESIECDLERKDAYAYTRRSARSGAIEVEAEAARSVGLKAEALLSAPLPFATAGALRFPNQAQFNPAQYLIGLAEAVRLHGGTLFENTRVMSVDSGKRWRVSVGRHHLRAAKVVLATNLPIAGPIQFDKLTQPRSHVAMAFRVPDEGTVDGMFIDIDRPTHSLRMGRDREGPLLIVLGAKFKTGQEADVAKRFGQLEKWVRGNIAVGETLHGVGLTKTTTPPIASPMRAQLDRKRPGYTWRPDSMPGGSATEPPPEC